MKKGKIFVLSAVAFLLVSCGESSKELEEVKTFAVDVATKVSKNMKDSVAVVYADAAKADSLALTFVADSVKVEAVDAVTYKVDFGEGNTACVKRDAEGNMTVTESKGFFAYADKDLEFAKKTGQWKQGLTDADQAVRMNDEGFAKYLLDNYNKTIKKGLKIVGEKTYGNEYIDGDWWISADGFIWTVKNDTPYNVLASSYTIVCKCGYAGYFPSGAKTTSVPGKDIPAGGTVTLKGAVSPNMESQHTKYISVREVSMSDFMLMDIFKGNEYDVYVKANK